MWSKERAQGYEIAKLITIQNNVWIGGHVFICPGVEIGENTVIGAGSVVSKNLPANVLAAGNPCKILRTLSEKDKMNLKNF